ncbi:phage portal protein [Anaerohalosphaeraceae bacterium U12dextr]
MKLWTNLKSLIASDLATKDYTVRLSQIARLWDAGLDLITGKGKGRPGQPYSQVDWVWICVNLILDTCKSIPMLISTDDDEVIESGPVADFLYSRTFANIFRDTLGFYTLCREAYWITTASDGIAPKTITVAGPNSVEPVVSRATGELVAYRVRLSAGKTVTLDPEDVFALRNFNPYDAFRGMGPQTAGQLAISTAYQASQFNEASLANGARIGMILKPLPGVKLDDEDVRKLKSQFKASHGGAANAGEAFVANGIDDIKTFTQTMADLQMVDLSRYNANTICALFGVPQEIVGLNAEAQYAHGPATQRFILYCIAPLLAAMADAIDDGIVSKFRFKSHLNKTAAFAASRFACGNLALKCRPAYRAKKSQALRSGMKFFCWFDTDSHPAIQEMMRDMLTKLLPLVEKGVPLNQIIDANDLPYDTSKMPWGEHWWVPMGQVPAQWTLDAGPDALTGPVIHEGTTDEDEDENGKAIPCDCDQHEIENRKSKMKKTSAPAFGPNMPPALPRSRPNISRHCEVTSAVRNPISWPVWSESSL